MSVAHRLGRVLEKVTRQSGRLPDTPEYGSWLLGKSTESQARRRVRIQVILTVFILVVNVLGLAVATLLVTVAFRCRAFSATPLLDHVRVSPPAYIALALTDWRILDHASHGQRAAVGHRRGEADTRGSAQHVPGAVAGGEDASDPVGRRRRRSSRRCMGCRTRLHSAVPVHHRIRGFVVATVCYLLTEFALRPVAAQALEAGPPPRRLTAGIMGRTMTVWLLSSGVSLVGIALTAVFALSLHNLTQTQFAFAVMILALLALFIGFLLMWITVMAYRDARTDGAGGPQARRGR